MDTIERLARLFERFPGIGPRQAQRFVQFLLRNTPSARREFVDAIQSLGSAVHQCPECMLWHAGASAKAAAKYICSICANPERDRTQLAVVANDADLLALERSGTFRGQYFVLGGTISLASEKTSGLRVKQLLAHIIDLRSRYKEFNEIIFAFPANPEGDATAVRIREDIVAHSPDIKVTALGRGLSTGSELEYADPETIKSALDSRR
ncbi:MAG: toprim domain-containing protein [Patescibacteria group bacterium]